MRGGQCIRRCRAQYNAVNERNLQCRRGKTPGFAASDHDLRGTQPQVVVASSDKAYGEQATLPYTEDAPLAGRHPYDASKSCADLLALTYHHTYRLPVCVTRCGNFFAQLVLTLPYPDTTGALKAWRSETLRAVNPSTIDVTGYVFMIELVDRAHLLGARIAQVPFVFIERREGVSKMSGSIFFEAFRRGAGVYFASLVHPEALAAVRMTLIVTAICVPTNVAFGLCAAWAIAKFEFRGKSFLITLIDLPFAVSPVIAGLVFVLVFGARGWLGESLDAIGVLPRASCRRQARRYAAGSVARPDTTSTSRFLAGW